MADQPQEQKPDTLLIAHVVVQVVDGTSFELYPFVDETDVKSKVSELIGGWASSGFLLRGPYLVPWHQVKLVEATSVEEITREEAHQRLMRWQAEDQKRAVQNFWKSKQEEGAEGEEKGGDKGEGDKDA